MSTKGINKIKQNRKDKKAPDNDRRDETLRGKLRELQKEIQQQQRIIQDLRNQLAGKDPKHRGIKKEEKEEANSLPPLDVCFQCKEPGIEVKSIWHPVKGDKIITYCKKCDIQRIIEQNNE